MIGIKLRKFPSMRIAVSMKSAEFCPNPYHRTHSNGNPIQTLRNVHTHWGTGISSKVSCH